MENYMDRKQWENEKIIRQLIRWGYADCNVFFYCADCDDYEGKREMIFPTEWEAIYVFSGKGKM